MAGKELDLALRIRADLGDGQKALQGLGQTVVDVGDSAQQASTHLTETGRAVDALQADSAAAATALVAIDNALQAVTQGGQQSAAQIDAAAAAVDGLAADSAQAAASLVAIESALQGVSQSSQQGASQVTAAAVAVDNLAADSAQAAASLSTVQAALQGAAQGGQQSAAGIGGAATAVDELGASGTAAAAAVSTIETALQATTTGAQAAASQLDQILQVVMDQAAETSRQLATVGETADQQTDRLRAMVAASLEQHSAIEAAASGNEQLSASLANVNANWQENARAQTAATNLYHNTERALVQQAEAERQAAEDAAAATEALRDQEAELGKLLGKIDPAIRELERLDELEQRLQGFKGNLLDSESFDLYNNKLQEQRKQLDASSNAMQAAGISAGQYKQAVRQLPAQITDIATSLATGMPLWMVAIQQGGQITDSFGGVSNSLKLLGDRIKSYFGIAGASSGSVAELGEELAGLAAQQTAVAKGSAAAGESLADLAAGANIAADAAGSAQKATGALSGTVSTVPTNFLAVLAALSPLAVAVGVLSTAIVKGIDDLNAYNDALIASGGYAGKTASQLIDLRNQLAGGKNFSEAQEAVISLVQDGRLAGDTFDSVAAAATEMAAATGRSASDVAKQFSAARSDVVALAAELSSQYHVVTASTYEQIQALQEQGQSMDALRVLAGEVAGEMKRRNAEITESTRGIAKLWDDATAALSRYWAQLKSGVAADQDTFKLQVLRQQVEDIDKGSWFSSTDRDSLKKQYLDEIAAIEKRLKLKDQERQGQQQDQEANDKYIASSKALNAELDNASPAKKRAAAIRELNNQFMALFASAEELGKKSPLLSGVEYDGKSFSGGAYDDLLKGIEDRYKDPKKPKTPATHLDDSAVTAAKTQLEQLQADFKNSEQNLEAEQKAGLLSYADYVTQRSDLIRKEKDEVTTAYQAQISALEALRNKSTTNASQRIELDQKIAQTRSDMVKAQKSADSELSVLLTNEQGRLIKEAQAVKTYTDALQQQYEALVQQGARAAAAVGMGSSQRTLFEQQNNLDDRLAQQKLELASQYGDGSRGMTLDEYNAKLKALETNHAEMTQQLRNNYSELQAAQADWTNGAKSAFDDYIDSANNAAGQTYQFFSDAFKGVEDAVVEAVTTGKASVADLARSVSADLARMAVRDLEANALKGLKDQFGLGEESSGASMTAGATAVSASATQLSAAGASLLTGAAAISTAAAALAAANGSKGAGGAAGAAGDGIQGIVDNYGAPSDVVSWPGADAAQASADAIGNATSEGASAMGDAITSASTAGSGTFSDELGSIFSSGADLFSGLFGSLFGGGAGGGSLLSSIFGGAGAAVVTAATGGHIRGPGTTTSDSIPAALSDYEFVTRAAVVQQPGALDFLHSFNAYGMAALDDWAMRVHHATGGLAGVPAPAMPRPTMPAGGIAEPAASMSATLKNYQNFYLVDDPNRIVDSAFSDAGIEKMLIQIARDPARFKSALKIG